MIVGCIIDGVGNKSILTEYLTNVNIHMEISAKTIITGTTHIKTLKIL